MAVHRGEMKRGNRYFVLRRHKFKVLLLFIVVVFSFVVLSNYSTSKSNKLDTKVAPQSQCKPGQEQCKDAGVSSQQTLNEGQSKGADDWSDEDNRDRDDSRNDGDDYDYESDTEDKEEDEKEAAEAKEPAEDAGELAGSEEKQDPDGGESEANLHEGEAGGNHGNEGDQTDAGNDAGGGLDEKTEEENKVEKIAASDDARRLEALKNYKDMDGQNVPASERDDNDVDAMGSHHESKLGGSVGTGGLDGSDAKARANEAASGPGELKGEDQSPAENSNENAPASKGGVPPASANRGSVETGKIGEAKPGEGNQVHDVNKEPGGTGGENSGPESNQDDVPPVGKTMTPAEDGVEKKEPETNAAVGSPEEEPVISEENAVVQGNDQKPPDGEEPPAPDTHAVSGDGEVKGHDLANIALGDTSPQCLVVPDRAIDCHPETGATQQSCQDRGCCWRESTMKGDVVDDNTRGNTDPSDQKEDGASPSITPPPCFYPANFPSYRKSEKIRNTDLGETVVLTRDTSSPYPKDVQQLTLDVSYESENRVHFKMYDPKVSRYEVPIQVPKATSRQSKPNYAVEYTDQPFGISVVRTATDAVLFNSSVGPLIFADQFLQLTTTLTSEFIYGLGEHRGPFLHDVNWNKFTFWTRDLPPQEGANLYGSHPFYLSLEKDGKAHGVFLLNSNAMEAILQPAPYLTWRTIGGVLDFYVFLGPTADEVIQQYTEVIGRPFMPPYWGLGFHLCRWGYETLEGTREVTQRMRDANIPQDVQWNDNDYTVDLKDFTLDEEKFGGIREFIEDLHQHGQHYVHILDPAISSGEEPGSYRPYDLGKEMDVFIKLNGADLIGHVWTNQSVFPDFTAPQTREWWTKLLSEWHERVPFDGLWIDMNEPSNFGDGSLTGCPDNTYDNPPYTPAVVGGHLNNFTLCASAEQNASVHYDVHNLYGLSEMDATHKTITSIEPGKRPFIISRSTYPSSGLYGGHWLGDNGSRWKDMYYSIPGILNFNLFGIPLVGADICGFNFNTTEPLCQRWHQLGAFYPFSRNHNSLVYGDTKDKTKAQDPTAFSAAMQDSTRSALMLRYSLLPYLYTLFHKSHVNGSTVARPLFFEFPDDPIARTVDTQFLWGPALLISPALQEDELEVKAYFTNHSWYDYFTGERMPETGTHVMLPTPMNKINLHIQGGYVIPEQIPSTTTVASRRNKFCLTVALCTKGMADGDLYWDDGESIASFESEEYFYVQFYANISSVVSVIRHSNYNFKETDGQEMDSVRVFGVPKRPASVTANGKAAKFEYTDQKVLMITDLSVTLLQPMQIVWR